MPSATTTKTAMAGTKRKSAPVKNSHPKESKKPKVDMAVRSVKKVTKETKEKKVPVKKVEESSDEVSEDSDSDGGIPLGSDIQKGSGLEEDESESEDVPAAADGLHPERAKAVVTNSEYCDILRIEMLTKS